VTVKNKRINKEGNSVKFRHWNLKLEDSCTTIQQKTVEEMLEFALLLRCKVGTMNVIISMQWAAI
jgi:hypothetical protein